MNNIFHAKEANTLSAAAIIIEVIRTRNSCYENMEYYNKLAEIAKELISLSTPQVQL